MIGMITLLTVIAIISYHHLLKMPRL